MTVLLPQSVTAEADIDPALLALKRRATAITRQLRRGRGDEGRVLLLKAVDAADAPAKLIENPRLEPIDKIVALVLLSRASPGTEPAYLPTQAELAKCVNVSDADTVARALGILRCRRWLTACQRSLQARDRRWPAAYAIHTAPLGIADTLYLDPEYPDDLEMLARRRHARLRRVAQQTLAQLPE